MRQTRQQTPPVQKTSAANHKTAAWTSSCLSDRTFTPSRCRTLWFYDKGKTPHRPRKKSHYRTRQIYKPNRPSPPRLQARTNRVRQHRPPLPQRMESARLDDLMASTLPRRSVRRRRDCKVTTIDEIEKQGGASNPGLLRRSHCGRRRRIDFQSTPRKNSTKN